MNKAFLKNITEAHSWLGLIISGLLFIVFFAGSIALFRGEITQWSMQPHFKANQGESLPVSQILEIAIKDRNFDAKEHLTLVQPNKYMPYHQVYIDVEHEAGQEDHDALLIDPITGEIIGSPDDFYLANFIYKLHYDLNIPSGSYLIGFVTLFFFFAIISGIFMHARKLISNFFKYRAQKQKRSQLLDMHNVVGVMSLPFTIMYAISGLIFNLVIIYQIAFAVILYKGDQQALLDDAGYQEIAPKWEDKAWENPKVDDILQNIKDKYNSTPSMIRFYNYGDQSAVMQIRGEIHTEFAYRYETAISVSNQEALYVKDKNNPNTLVKGLYVISRLHFGDYAGLDLRVLYFILGIGVCGLIITGNLLWIEKRSKQRNQSPKALAFVNNFTLWSTGGVVIATAVAFITERIVPITFSLRSDYMVYSFIATLILVACVLPFNSDKKVFLGYLLKISGLLLLSTVVLDWVMFGTGILDLWQQGIKSVIATEIGLMLVACIFIFTSTKLIKPYKKAQEANENDAVLEVQN